MLKINAALNVELIVIRQNKYFNEKPLKEKRCFSAEMNTT